MKNGGIKPTLKKKIRLDLWLVESGLVQNRNEAQRLIMAGKVLSPSRIMDKSGEGVYREWARENISLRAKPHPFVGRGGLKLEGALAAFDISVQGLNICDLGSSTGGFVDILLRGQAAHVFAVDVGEGLMDWGLRNDKRVILLERKNARELSISDLERAASTERGLDIGLEDGVDMVTGDLSFISLSKVMPAIYGILKDKCFAILLIKPQFEAGRNYIGKGGIVKSACGRNFAITSTIKAGLENGLGAQMIIPSPIKGGKGNVEYLGLFLKNGGLSEKLDRFLNRK